MIEQIAGYGWADREFLAYKMAEAQKTCNSNMFQVELVWNREWVRTGGFNFVAYGPQHHDLASAIKYAKYIENSGDGARVKKTQVVDANGDVVWAYGKKIIKNDVHACLVKEPLYAEWLDAMSDEDLLVKFIYMNNHIEDFGD
jgi:hypothetical protein